MKKKSLYFLALIFLITSCAPLAPMLWVKPGGSQAELAQARYVCLQNSQQREIHAHTDANYHYDNQVVKNDELFNACMNALGWRWQRQSVAQTETAQTDDSHTQASKKNSSGYQQTLNDYHGFAAVAVDKSTLRFFNTAGKSSEFAANQAAMDSCKQSGGTGCVISLTVKAKCVTEVLGLRGNVGEFNHLSTGYGDTLDEAERMAFNKCNSKASSCKSGNAPACSNY